MCLAFARRSASIFSCSAFVIALDFRCYCMPERWTALRLSSSLKSCHTMPHLFTLLLVFHRLHLQHWMFCELRGFCEVLGAIQSCQDHQILTPQSGKLLGLLSMLSTLSLGASQHALGLFLPPCELFGRHGRTKCPKSPKNRSDTKLLGLSNSSVLEPLRFPSFCYIPMNSYMPKKLLIVLYIYTAVIYNE